MATDPKAAESALTAPIAETEPEIESTSVAKELEVSETGVADPAITEAPTATIGSAAIEAAAPAIEADDLESLETDSAYGDHISSATSTSSLKSSVLKYRMEHGRSYHAFKDGAYLVPNDEEEQERLDLQNHVFLLINQGRLYDAPINKPARVLDVGTGTGIWAVDFADQHPESHVIGCDLSPIQPTFVPPNLEFEIDDISARWLHKPFDYIHSRAMAGSLLSYRSMLASAFENLVPGGWCEAVEFEIWMRDQREDPTGDEKERPIKCAPMINQWQAGLREAGEKIGRRFDSGSNLKEWFEGIGYTNVVELKLKVPIAPWPRHRAYKEMGVYQQQNMLDASSSYGSAHFTRVLGWSIEEFTVLSAGVKNELKDSSLQLYSNYWVVYGQKPETAGAATTGDTTAGDATTET